MLYLYCPKIRLGALELADAIGARRVKRFDGLRFQDASLESDDTVVCWGGALPYLGNIRVLNASNEKLTQDVISRKMMYTINVAPVYEGVINEDNSNKARCNDLPPGFYVNPSLFEQEYRLHMFSGKVVKSGTKAPRPGYTTEDWRHPDLQLARRHHMTYDNGWHVSYQLKAPAPVVKLAKTVLSYLALDFAVVNIFKLAGSEPALSNYNLYLRNVDTAPALDSVGVALYAKAILAWIGGNKDDVGGVRNVEPDNPF